MSHYNPEKASFVFGLSKEELIEVRKKLDCLGLDLSDLLEFLDRDKVQLFAEQKTEIKHLKHQISLAVNALKIED